MDSLGASSFVAESIVHVQDVVSLVYERRDDSEELAASLERFLRIQKDLRSLNVRLEVIDAERAASVVDDASSGSKHHAAALARAQELDVPGGSFDLLADKLRRVKKRVHTVNSRQTWNPKKSRLVDEQKDILDLIDYIRNRLDEDDEGLLQTLHSRQEEKQVVTILDWICPTSLGLDGPLFPTSPTGDHAGRRFTETDRVYQQWVDDQDWQFNCFGVPGCGKSVRALAVFRDLQRRCNDQPQVTVLSLFFYRQQRASQSLRTVFCSLLRQALTRSSDVRIPLDIQEQWKQARMQGSLDRGLGVEDAKAYLYRELDRFQSTYLVVDALDDVDSSMMSKLENDISELRKIKRVRIFSTNRTNTRFRYDQIICCKCKKLVLDLYFRCKSCAGFFERSFDICLDCYDSKGERCEDPRHKMTPPDRVNIEIRPDDMAPEMKSYVNDFLARELCGGDKGDDDEDIYLGSASMLSDLKQELEPSSWNSIPGKVCEAANGNFNYAESFLRQLCRQPDVEGAVALVQKLESLILNTELYRGMLNSCLYEADQDDAGIARSFMTIVSCASEILNFEQLAHAVAIQPRDQHKGDFTPRLKKKDRVRRATQGIVTVENSGEVDSFPVGWFHDSMSTYIANNGKDWFPEADQVIFDACISYLGLRVFSKPFGTSEERARILKDYPFASYAARYWGSHAYDLHFTAGNAQRVLQVFADRDRVDCIMQIAWHSQSSSRNDGKEGEVSRDALWDVQNDISALHACSFYNLHSLCEALLISNANPDVVEHTYNQTPLIYACRRGNFGIVSLLLEAGANPNHLTTLGSTPLLEAIEHGREDIFELLLERTELDINKVTQQPNSTTALIKAVEKDQSSMVKRILELPATDINQANAKGRTALITATQEVNLQIVNLLLGNKSLDLSRRDLNSRTALDRTADHNMPWDTSADKICEIADILLRDPRRPEISDAAVIMAIEGAKIPLLECFAEATFNESYRDSSGQSFLHIAASLGETDVVRTVHRYLASRPSFDIDRLDRYQATALHAACRDAEHLDTIKYLLDSGANAMAVNHDGHLACHLARIAQPNRWHTDVRPMFVEAVEPAALDNFPPTNILLRPQIRLDGMDTLRSTLSSSRDILDPEDDPYTHSTILHLAMKRADDDDCLEILRLLLPRCGDFVNAQNDYQRTCLHMAVIQPLPRSLKLLTESAGIDLDLLDRWNLSAFELAQMYDRFDMSVALCAAGACLPPANTIRPEVLHEAVSVGEMKAIKALVEAGVDLLRRDVTTLTTPLQKAGISRKKALDDVTNKQFRRLSVHTATDRVTYQHARLNDPEVRKWEEIVKFLQQAVDRAPKAQVDEVAQEIPTLIAAIKRADRPNEALHELEMFRGHNVGSSHSLPSYEDALLAHSQDASKHSQEGADVIRLNGALWRLPLRRPRPVFLVVGPEVFGIVVTIVVGLIAMLWLRDGQRHQPYVR